METTTLASMPSFVSWYIRKSTATGVIETVTRLILCYLVQALDSPSATRTCDVMMISDIIGPNSVLEVSLKLISR